MAFSSLYKNTIWTNHVLERLDDRNIPQELAWKTLRFPDIEQKGKKTGTKEFIKKFGEKSITVIASQNEKREWVILSCWAHPPFPGSIDIAKKKAYLLYKQSSLKGKIWIRIKQMIGLYEQF
ncbi:DUF4258 domain-containing protein [Candidatus Woesebacteria bacterium]|nr:DUF4258 domain-containing protein [Candidatus Woesebacteria bacterium]